MAVKIKNIDWVKTEFTLGDVVIRFESADRPGFGKLVITNVDKTKVLTYLQLTCWRNNERTNLCIT